MSSATGEPGLPGVARGRVTVGGSELQLGRPAGMVLTSGADGGSDDLPKLAKALEEDNGKDPEAPDHGLGTEANAAVERVSDVTAQIERGNTLFNEVADGQLSVADVKDEVDVLLGLLGRLDREGRWREELALARALSGLLGLVRRWMELVRSLRAALGAATKLADTDAIGWAEHELGSLHLVGGNAAAAERRLGQAREIRQRLGDRDGLAVTDHNLQVLCRMLRQLLRDGRLTQDDQRDRGVRNRRILALAVAALLLVGGGVAGAVIRGSGGHATHNNAHNPGGPTPVNGGQNPGNPGGQPTDQTAPKVQITGPASGSYTPKRVPGFSGTGGIAPGDLPAITVAITPSGPAAASKASETSLVALTTSTTTAPTTTTPPTTAAPTTTSTTSTTTTPPLECGAPPALHATVQDGNWETDQPHGLLAGCEYEAVASQSDEAGNTGKSDPVTLTIVGS
jgi:hypothetical protein